ncbi:FAD-dependent oxidoreductase [Pseudomonadota bacterium]
MSVDPIDKSKKWQGALPNNRLSINDHYDMVIIGGGIQGATLAWEASRHKLSVLIVEAEDWGWGTSANNLKVIHGGIRYIQNLDIKRCIQSIREQSLLSHLAPNLINSLSCSIPAPRKILYNKYTYWLAFKFFELLKILVTPRAIEKVGGKTCIHKAEQYFSEQELGRDLMRQSFLQWQDAQVQSPERLVYSFIQSAQDFGAVCYNYVKATQIDPSNNKVFLVDQLSDGAQQSCTSDFLIDTTGPWHNDLNLINQPSVEKIYFAQGVNLYTPRKILGHTLGLQSQNDRENRLLYVTPWREGTLFGTWYFEDREHTNKITENKVSACLSDLNKAFPNANFQNKDISVIHSGLLPLKSGSTSGPYDSLSDKAIFNIHRNPSKSGMYASIVGVKYTTARHASSEFLQKYVLKKAYRSVFKDLPDVRLKYSASQVEQEQISASICSHYGSLETNTIRHLAENYGFAALLVVAQIETNSELAALIPGCDREIKAEISYCLESENVYTLSDLLIRRIGIGAVGMPTTETIDYSSRIMAEYFHWDRSTTEYHIEKIKSSYFPNSY